MKMTFPKTTTFTKHNSSITLICLAVNPSKEIIGRAKRAAGGGVFVCLEFVFAMSSSEWSALTAGKDCAILKTTLISLGSGRSLCWRLNVTGQDVPQKRGEPCHQNHVLKDTAKALVGQPAKTL